MTTRNDTKNNGNEKRLKEVKLRIHKTCFLRLVISSAIFSIVTFFLTQGKSINGVADYLKPFMEVFSSKHLVATLAVVFMVYAFPKLLSDRYKDFGVENKRMLPILGELGEEIPRTVVSFGGIVIGICFVALVFAIVQSEWAFAAQFAFMFVSLICFFHIIAVLTTFCFTSTPREK
jgi:hypothetical protein